MIFSLIGLGLMGQKYITNINQIPTAQIKTLCSTKESSYINLQEKPSHNHYWVDSYKYAISFKDIEAVIIATGPKERFEIAKFALENKRHCILEKPLVFSLEEALELKAIAQKNNLNVIVDFIHLFNSKYRELKSNYLPENEQVNILIENFGSGPCRNYSSFFDYGSHSLAIALDLIKPGIISADISKFELVNDKNQALYYINLNYASKKVVIQCGNLGATKQNRVLINYGDKLLSYVDDFQQNSLKLLIEEFITKTDNKELFNNLSLACDVTKVLIELNQKIV